MPFETLRKQYNARLAEQQRIQLDNENRQKALRQKRAEMQECFDSCHIQEITDKLMKLVPGMRCWNHGEPTRRELSWNEKSWQEWNVHITTRDEIDIKISEDDKSLLVNGDPNTGCTKLTEAQWRQGGREMVESAIENAFNNPYHDVHSYKDEPIEGGQF